MKSIGAQIKSSDIVDSIEFESIRKTLNFDSPPPAKTKSKTKKYSSAKGELDKMEHEMQDKEREIKENLAERESFAKRVG